VHGPAPADIDHIAFYDTPLNPTRPPTSAPYRADIDGLRGIAVLAVVAFHAFPEVCPSGFVGVDVFFVISGYLISGIILADIASNRFTYRSFYSRRIRRIFPSLAVVLVACLSLGWLYLLPDEFLSLGKQTAGSAAFLGNFIAWRQTGYFDQIGDLNLLVHLWSLGVEEQFYLIWPMLLAGFVARRWISALTGLIALSLALNVIFVSRSPDATFYLPASRLWELLIGAFLAAAEHQHSRFAVMTRRLFRLENSQWCAVLGVLALAASLIFIDETRRFPGWWALLPTLGAAALILAGPTAWPNRHVLSSAPLVLIGLISYPLYLWHWPLLVFGRILTESPSRNSQAVLVALAFILATLTYRLVERPIRFGLRRAFVVPGLSLALVLIGVTGSLAATGRIKPRAASGSLERVWEALPDWHPFANGFRQTRFKSIDLQTAGAGDTSYALFFGDSNVAQFGPRIGRLILDAPALHKAAIVAGMGGCPPIPKVLERHHTGCASFVADAFELAQSRQIDTVVVAACWVCYFRPDVFTRSRVSQYYYDDSGTPRFVGRDMRADESAFASLRSMLAALAAQKPTYLVLSVPSGLSADPRQMIARGVFAGGPFFRSTALTRSSMLTEYGAVRDRLKQVARDAGARAIDPLDVMCPDESCPVIADDGRLIYKDAIHLRPFWIEQRASFIDETLRKQ
jgi:peptidoglycan/LPS O-acetylase OafA/YrhL